MRHLCVLAALVVLSGCASTSQGVKKDFAFQPGSETGLVVLSTRINDNCGKVMNPVNINYSQVNGKTHGLFLLKNFLIKPDFEDPKGYFYIRALPAGQYALDMVDMPGTVLASAILSPPLRFDVKPGVVRYLGELTVSLEACDGKKEVPQPKLAITDQHERDGKLFDARMTSLSSKSFERAILHG